MALSSRRRLKAKAAAIDLMASRGDIFDPVRRRRVALTPEEWVRQQTIALLHDRMGYPYELMQVEGAISLNGLTKRCDIVVYDAQVRPRMIVECKREPIRPAVTIWCLGCPICCSPTDRCSVVCMSRMGHCAAWRCLHGRN